MRFPDMFKQQTIETQLQQDQVFLHVNNRRRPLQLQLWEYINKNFAEYSAEALDVILFSTKTSFRQCLLQRGVFVMTYPNVKLATELHRTIQ